MSLVDEFMVDCVMMDRKTGRDQYGSFVEEWIPGAGFKAAIVLDDSIQAQVAAAQGVKGVYTVTTEKGFKLNFHDTFKRLEDDQVFRVTKKGKATPDSASLSMRQVTAEEWDLPNG